MWGDPTLVRRGKNLLKRKDKYLHNQLKKLLKVPLTTNNTLYCDSLTLNGFFALTFSDVKKIGMYGLLYILTYSL